MLVFLPHSPVMLAGNVATWQCLAGLVILVSPLAFHVVFAFVLVIVAFAFWMERRFSCNHFLAIVNGVAMSVFSGRWARRCFWEWVLDHS
mmetsp:Transcript_45390/g.96962  ORF Transcript_45390/g.96962 Transcript_45390/m.96962 type:complete len:90 (-) Transcript_45390:7-276(-)